MSLRALAQPGFSERIDPDFDVHSLAARLPRGLPMLPQRSSLDPLAEQWVVTDGANLQLERWLASAPVDRVIREGAATENAAVVLLALRPSLRSPERSDVVVGVYNAGRSIAQRRLDVSSHPLDSSHGAGEDRTWSTLSLKPGETRRLRFETGRAPIELAARLSPTDALAEDDTLTLRVPRPLKTSIAVDPACGPALVAAVKANPAVVATDAAGAELLVDCTQRWRGSRRARLAVGRPSNTQPVLESAYWSARLGLPEIPPTLRLRAASESPAAGPGDEPLLTAGGHPLVVLHAGPPRTVETNLDVLDQDLAARAEFPLLIATLLDLTDGEELLGQVAARSRALEGTVIAPASAIDGGTAARGGARERTRGGVPDLQGRTSAAAGARGALDLTPAWLAIALPVLMWETLAAARALRLRRRYYSGAA